MKLIFYTLFSLLFFSGCETIENEVIVINPKESKNSVLLKVDKILNDSTIALSWTPYTGSGFKEYRLSRSAEVLINGTFRTDHKIIKTFSHKDSLRFTERDMPFSGKINYFLDVITDSPNWINSGLSYERPGTYHKINFNDVLINTAAKYLYLFNKDTGSITLFDYDTKKEIKKISLNSSIGFCALGDGEGGIKNELYVPTVHGWVYILDAFTLETKDKIYIGGEKVSAVVAVAGKLFVSSTDRSFGSFYDNALKVYDRKTKKLIGRTGYWSNTRLLYLEGTGIELIDITTNISPTDLSYYQFDSFGKLIAKKEDTYHGDHPLDPLIVSSFPDGSKFITASSGAVYTRELKYEKSLSGTYENRYLDFAFNASGTSIYAALKQQKKVEEIAYPAGKVINTFPTLFPPARIFRDGNQLICLTTSGSGAGTYVFIEKINL